MSDASLIWNAWLLLMLALGALYLVLRCIRSAVRYYRRNRPMGTWKRRGFLHGGDDPEDDSRSSIDNFKRMHRR